MYFGGFAGEFVVMVEYGIGFQGVGKIHEFEDGLAKVEEVVVGLEAYALEPVHEACVAEVVCNEGNDEVFFGFIVIFFVIYFVIAPTKIS